jgi:hypothetical protein
MEHLGVEETKNEIDDQGTGFDTQSDENDPGNNMQPFNNEVVTF